MQVILILYLRLRATCCVLQEHVKHVSALDDAIKFVSPSDGALADATALCMRAASWPHAAAKMLCSTCQQHWMARVALQVRALWHNFAAVIAAAGLARSQKSQACQAAQQV